MLVLMLVLVLVGNSLTRALRHQCEVIQHPSLVANRKEQQRGVVLGRDVIAPAIEASDSCMYNNFKHVWFHTVSSLVFGYFFSLIESCSSPASHG
ncbi:hypothetical protein BDV30DRAFT_207153, partial [Aspergillus minisclerotigenes]